MALVDRRRRAARRRSVYSDSARSEPVIVCPRASRIWPIADMWMPPAPTRCTRCGIAGVPPSGSAGGFAPSRGHLPHHARERLRGVRPRQLAPSRAAIARRSRSLSSSRVTVASRSSIWRIESATAAPRSTRYAAFRCWSEKSPGITTAGSRVAGSSPSTEAPARVTARSAAAIAQRHLARVGEAGGSAPAATPAAARAPSTATAPRRGPRCG